MIEAAMIWNEPNNKSHWDFEIDPEWTAFSRMIRLAAEAVEADSLVHLREGRVEGGSARGSTSSPAPATCRTWSARTSSRPSSTRS